MRDILGGTSVAKGDSLVNNWDAHVRKVWVGRNRIRYPG